MANKLKKDDEVIILTGKDRGKQGKILKVNVVQNTVVVDGLNIAKKHKKPTQQAKGDIVDVPMPVHRSNVKLICPVAKKPTKVSIDIVDGKRKRKSRVSKEFI